MLRPGGQRLLVAGAAGGLATQAVTGAFQAEAAIGIGLVWLNERIASGPPISPPRWWVRPS